MHRPHVGIVVRNSERVHSKSYLDWHTVHPCAPFSLVAHILSFEMVLRHGNAST